MNPEQQLRESLLARLDELADRPRHPALELDRFTDAYNESGHLRPDEELVARRRRAALIHAGNLVIDDCIADHRTIEWDEETGRAVPGSGVGESFVWEAFPPRFRRSYDADFFARVLVTVVKVGHDLARPDAQAAACIGEEIIINAICSVAEQVIEDADLGHAPLRLTEILLEDTDFEDLYDQSLDGSEHDPATQRACDKWVPDVRNWFTPFNDDRIVHPYVQTADTTPQPHDLMLRIRGDNEAFEASRDPQIIDDPAHISGLDPSSDAVAEARKAEADAGTTNGPAQWVPDATAPQSSYNELVSLVDAAGSDGSGWLTWEPHEGAGTVRTDPVIILRPHRHFPAAVDQPWLDVSFGGVMMAVPLSAVVSYRPDPAVRQRWESAFSDPAAGAPEPQGNEANT